MLMFLIPDSMNATLRTLVLPTGVFDDPFVVWSTVAVAALIVVVLGSGLR